MKINKAKLLVGTLAIVATAATVGSISGTVAWFQYSTRSTAAYQGASAHCSENLQIRIRAADEATYPWQPDLRAADITAYLAAHGGVGGAARANGNALRPVSSQELDFSSKKVCANDGFYKNPIYQYADKATWKKATLEDFIVLPLELRVLDVDGNTAAPSYLAKDIYITDLTMAAAADHTGYTASQHLDLTPALRVGVRAGTNAASLTDYTTFSTHGKDVKVYGKLDLNADGVADKEEGYEWDTRADVVYGDSGDVANSTIATAIGASDPAIVGVANDSDPYSINGVAIGTTNPSAAAALQTVKVDLVIYLEGWQQIGTPTIDNDVSGTYADLAAMQAAVTATTLTPVTDKTYGTGDGLIYKWDGTKFVLQSNGTIWDAAKGIGAEFNVGIRFSADAHVVH